MTELEKLQAGINFISTDKEILEVQKVAKDKCDLLNATPRNDRAKRAEILKSLFAKTGERIVIESPFYCDYGICIEVGEDFYANHGCTILDTSKVKIGKNCMLAPGVVITAVSHPNDPIERKKGIEIAKPITFGDNVWIGANATILPGVTLGDNVVVGAGSVVTKSFPSNVVIAGIPAKIIKNI